MSNIWNFFKANNQGTWTRLTLAEFARIFCKFAKFYPYEFFLNLFGDCYVVFITITATQLHSIKSEVRFCAGSNSAQGVSEVCDVIKCISRIG